MTLEQVNDAGDKYATHCEVCGAPKTFKLPLGGKLCEQSHHKQRMAAYAAMTNDPAGRALLLAYGEK